ncbi:DUF2282 domain-containing protein [Acidithiobacillus sp.]|uniref:BufA1 family periplasmic bufferin-type metallophore n=1 Tax=Acidithiobacillus sp. TaxID=1872118 RepID=UPI00262C8C83|nr:DUF2282 domain-containing protein [Acidithiobacillus sp.]
MMKIRQSKQMTITTLIASVALFGAVDAYADGGSPAVTGWHHGWVQCFGANAPYKNDCGTTASSCAGRDPTAHDPNAFVWMPAGVCTEVGGTATPGPVALRKFEMMRKMPKAKVRAMKQIPMLHEAQLYYASSAAYFAEKAANARKMMAGHA